MHMRHGLPDGWSQSHTHRASDVLMGLAEGLLVVILLVLLSGAWRRRSDHAFWKRLKMMLRRAQFYAGVLWVALCTTSVLTLPYVMWYIPSHMGKSGYEDLVVASATFMVLACGLSFRDMARHLQNYSSPVLQKKIVRILFMVPLYALTCFLNVACAHLKDTDTSGHVSMWLTMSTIVREVSARHLLPVTQAVPLGLLAPVLAVPAVASRSRCVRVRVRVCCAVQAYEAFTVWNFMELMVEFLFNAALVKDMQANRGTLRGSNSPRGTRTGRAPQQMTRLSSDSSPGVDGSPKADAVSPRRSTSTPDDDYSTLITMLEEAHQPPHMFPLCKMKPWKMGKEFLHKTRNGVLQYVPMQIACSIATVLCKATGHMHTGEISLRAGYFWITAVKNFSQCWALYCLVLFYHGTADMLTPIQPLGKFLSIKLVVFFTWWQSVVLVAFVQFNWLPVGWLTRAIHDEIMLQSGNNTAAALAGLANHSFSPTPFPSSSLVPSLAPSFAPSLTFAPSLAPTPSPSWFTNGSLAPTLSPTTFMHPSFAPSFAPSFPNATPGANYTLSPSPAPSAAPSFVPPNASNASSAAPSLFPTSMPSFAPSFAPSSDPAPANGSWDGSWCCDGVKAIKKTAVSR